MQKEFYNLADAANFLGLSEQDVIHFAAESLPVCFHYRGLLAMHEKGSPIKARFWFDGYLRSRAPVRLRTVTEGVREVANGGHRALQEYRSVDDMLMPTTVDIVRQFRPSATPPAAGASDLYSRLNDDNTPSQSSVTRERWLFMVDDLRTIQPATSTAAAAPEQTDPGKQDDFNQAAREPMLNKGGNKRHTVEEWVKWCARNLKQDDDDATKLAGKIHQRAQRFEYESERGPISVESIKRMLPTGSTGGRGRKPGSQSKK